MAEVSFLFYKSYYDAAKVMSPEDQVAYFMALCAYVFEDKEPELTGAALVGWSLSKPNLDANIKKRRDGAKGGRPSKKTEPVVSASDCNTETTGYESEKADKGQREKGNMDEGQKDKDKGQGSAPAERWPPAFAEVSAFFTAHGGTKRQARAFYDQYQSAGWIADGRPVENWQGLCIGYLQVAQIDREASFDTLRAQKMRMVAGYG